MPGLRIRAVESVSNQIMTLSRRLILSQDELDRTIAHEQIHQWQADVLRIRCEHGRTFRRRMAEINGVKGRDFVTVRGDRVEPGAFGGAEGRRYHVAIFERCGKPYGGFSLRPFNEKVLSVLARESLRYRSVVTTCHDAQCLTDLSRISPSSRNWRCISKEIHDAIMAGEVAEQVPGP